MVNANFFTKIKDIYDCLDDDISKMIFVNRLMYSLTNEAQYIAAVADNSTKFKLVKDKNFISIHELFIDSIKSGIIIFGAGFYAMDIYNLINTLGYRVECFCDSNTNKQKELYCGLPVISPETLSSTYKKFKVVISSYLYLEEIYQQLLSMKFPSNQIYMIKNTTQYFEKEIFKPKEHEIFIDAGCYNCESILDFIDWCKGDFDKIYAFEPDSQNFKKCVDILKQQNFSRTELINKGLWSKKEILCFTNSGTGDSSISKTGTNLIETVSLDEMFMEEKITFMKFDIEGAELEALNGAKNIIQRYRPRLAICIYHKNEDILEIPLYIKKLVPDYRFYLRHYSAFDYETVLYAI